MFRWLLFLGMWATVSGFAMENGNSPREQILLTCTPIPFEDILKIVVLSRESTSYLVLSQKYGEIQTRLNLNVGHFKESKIFLPPWENQRRNLEWRSSSWVINLCGESYCEPVPVNCH